MKQVCEGGPPVIESTYTDFDAHQDAYQEE